MGLKDYLDSERIFFVIESLISCQSFNPINHGSDKSSLINGLPGPCPARGAHQLAVPFGLVVIIGYQYGMYYTRYPETQG